MPVQKAAYKMGAGTLEAGVLDEPDSAKPA
jgi:hypothetical protein